MDEKEVQCKMEAITGKPQTETEFVTSVWQRIFDDMRVGKDKTNKRSAILSCVLAGIIIVMTVVGLYFYDKQQDKYLAQIESLSAKNEKMQKDFIDFLSEYDFESYDQSGDGTNYLNRDVQGDANNGTAPTTSQTEGQ